MVPSLRKRLEADGKKQNLQRLKKVEKNLLSKEP
jgi:hypothetical protein